MSLEITIKIVRVFKIVCLLLLLAAITVINVNAQPSTNLFQTYISNDAYFIKDIDINNDGVLDKVVSHNNYEGFDLLFFLNKNETYKLIHKSINFYEDGGKLIKDISAINNKGPLVLKIETYFPKGKDETDYLISYKNNEWFLDKTVHRLITWQNDYTKLYTCILEQKIPLKAFSSPYEYVESFKTLPDNWQTNKCCTASYSFEDNLADFLLRFEQEDYRTWQDVERYEQLIEKFGITNNNIALYIEIITELKQNELFNEAVYLEAKVNEFLLGKP